MSDDVVSYSIDSDALCRLDSQVVPAFRELVYAWAKARAKNRGSSTVTGNVLVTREDICCVAASIYTGMSGYLNSLQEHIREPLFSKLKAAFATFEVATRKGSPEPSSGSIACDAAEVSAEVLRLQALVDKLPKTADGVPIVPGMPLFYSSNTGTTEMFASDMHVSPSRPPEETPWCWYSTMDFGACGAVANETVPLAEESQADPEPLCSPSSVQVLQWTPPAGWTDFQRALWARVVSLLCAAVTYSPKPLREDVLVSKLTPELQAAGYEVALESYVRGELREGVRTGRVPVVEHVINNEKYYSFK